MSKRTPGSGVDLSGPSLLLSFVLQSMPQVWRDAGSHISGAVPCRVCCGHGAREQMSSFWAGPSIHRLYLLGWVTASTPWPSPSRGRVDQLILVWVSVRYEILGSPC